MRTTCCSRIKPRTELLLLHIYCVSIQTLFIAAVELEFMELGSFLDSDQIVGLLISALVRLLIQHSRSVSALTQHAGGPACSWPPAYWFHSFIKELNSCRSLLEQSCGVQQLRRNVRRCSDWIPAEITNSRLYDERKGERERKSFRMRGHLLTCHAEGWFHIFTF